MDAGGEAAGWVPLARKLPCTILSGFLGSGKTTLLMHILRNKEGLRCAVIVNDMAELNIDASLLKNAALVQAEERLVEMSNGCICCTLREDLAVEVGRLAAASTFDYCVIESTGIGEPMQVAETFAMAAGEGGCQMQDVARLDTTVTVVDAANLMANFASVESLRDCGEQVDEEDERGVVELLVDQIEFADVILLNKVDLVSADEQRRLLGLLHTLNPGADIVPTQFSRVPLTRVINTGRFSMEKAAQNAGWLKTLQEGFTPETEEYDIGSLVYRARQPFHPARLHAFLTSHFVLQEPDWSKVLAAEQGGHSHDPVLCNGQHHDSHQQHSQAQAEPSQLAAPVQQAVQQASQASQQAAAALQRVVQETAAGCGSMSIQEQALLAAVAAATSAAVAASSAAALLLQLQLGGSGSSSSMAVGSVAALHSAAASQHHHHHHEQPPVTAAEAQRRQALLTASYGQLLRSKGFAWLATRPDLCGDWSQAGGILRLGVGGPWYAALPDEAWPKEEEQRAAVLKDFQEPHGDRRQELVLIGVRLDGKALTSALDACLCSDREMVMAAAGHLKDPFAEWPTLEQILDAGDDDDEGQQQQLQQQQALEEGSSTPCPPPGTVHYVTNGAAELQECFDGLVAQRAAVTGPVLGVVSWHAEWCEPCHEAAQQLGQLARQHPGAAFFTLDVEACAANTTFALEKVMRKPESRRVGAKPTLKSGDKFPCITLHYLPSLQPVVTLAGSAALQQLQQLLAEQAAAAASSLPAPATSAAPPSSSGSEQAVAVSASASMEPSRLVVLRKGAAEAKELLAAGRASGAPVLVVWTRGGGKETASTGTLRSAAAEVAATTCGLVLVDADATVSKANELLAGALKVRGYPEIHVYRDMKLASKLTDASATPTDLLHLASQLGDGASTTSTSVPAMAPAMSVTMDPPAELHPAGPSGPFDPPPPKFAKPGATKRFPDGQLGHFFPKMPCLRCGCPWWSSEEWDARCLRCGWDCESSGYDNDSQPLPRYRPKWEQFVAAIREGCTPAWSAKSKK